MSRFLILSFLFIFSICYSQNQEIEDFLMKSESFRINRDFKKSIAALHHAHQLSTTEYQYAKVFAFYSRTYASMDSLALSKKYADKSFESAQSPLSKAYAYYAKATLNNYLDENDSVFKYVKLALQELKKMEDNDWLKAKLYYLEYQVFSNIEDYNKAKTSIELSLQHSRNTNDKTTICTAMIGKANVYEHLFTTTLNRNDVAISKSLMLEALDFAERYPVSDYTRAIVYNNLSNLLQKNFPKEFELSGNQYLEKATYYAEKSGNQNVIASVYGMQSQLASKENNHQKAVDWLLKAYETIEKQSSPNYYLLYNISKDLVHVYQKSGELDKALDYSEIAEKNKDLLNDRGNRAQIQKLEIANEIKEKNQKIAYLETQNLLSYLYLGIALVSIIALFLVIKNRKYKITLSQSREELLTRQMAEAKLLSDLKEKEKQEIWLKVKIEQEENKRILAEKNLAEMEKDSLKKALMVGTLQIEQKNQMLKEIDEKLSKGERFDLKKMLKKDLQNYESLDPIKTQLQEIHPEFFNRLQERAEKKLTDLDLRFCAYKLIGLDTKQIANLLNIDPKSVRMSKYRIKQKFSLDDRQDLEDFLELMSKV